MKAKNLVILVVVAAALAGLAVLTSKKQGGAATPDVLGKLLLPDLPVNDVEKVVVQSGDGTAVVARVEGTWVAANKSSYPVDFAKVRSMLISLSNLKIGQVAHVGTGQLGDLRLMPPGKEKGGTLVQLLGASGKKIAELLLGATHERKSPGQEAMMGMGGFPDGRFLTADAGKNVYLVSESLADVSSKVKDWLDAELLNENSADILDVSITGPDRQPVKLKRPEKGKPLELEGLAADKEELNTSKIYGVESAISYLRLTDVADPALPEAQLGMDKAVTFEATTSQGAVYTLKIGGSPQGSADRYVKIAATLKPEAPAPEPKKEEAKPEEKKPENPGEAKPAEKQDAKKDDAKAAPQVKEDADKKAKEEAEKKAKERKDLEEKIRKTNEKLGKWTFVLESYKTDSMLVKREDLVKAKEQPKPEGTNQPPAAAAAPAPVPPPAVTTPPSPPAPAPAPAPAAAPAPAPAAQPKP